MTGTSSSDFLTMEVTYLVAFCSSIGTILRAVTTVLGRRRSVRCSPAVALSIALSVARGGVARPAGITIAGTTAVARIGIESVPSVRTVGHGALVCCTGTDWMPFLACEFIK